MKCLVCEEDVEEEHFYSHVNTKHEGNISPWKYIVAMQKRLERVKHHIEKSHGPMDQPVSHKANLKSIFDPIVQ
ncbi:MAG TPA: hypothetical protein VFR94_01840 [Nitrososphaeraceae archaeon]|nr:hypothetical protein [Nitrososphaeraceae archaeon]